MLRLGGLRINPRTNGPHRNAAIAGITLKTTATGASRTVTVPANSTLLPIGFSPDDETLRLRPHRRLLHRIVDGRCDNGESWRAGAAALNAAGRARARSASASAEWTGRRQLGDRLPRPSPRTAPPCPRRPAPEGPEPAGDARQAVAGSARIRTC